MRELVRHGKTSCGCGRETAAPTILVFAIREVRSTNRADPESTRVRSPEWAVDALRLLAPRPIFHRTDVAPYEAHDSVSASVGRLGRRRLGRPRGYHRGATGKPPGDQRCRPAAQRPHLRVGEWAGQLGATKSERRRNVSETSAALERLVEQLCVEQLC